MPAIGDFGTGVAVDGVGNACIATINGRAIHYGSYWEKGAGRVGFGVAVDSAGNAYITGCIPASPNWMDDDAFLAKFTSTGSLAWKTQLGSPRYDQANGVAVDSAGNAYITGYAGGSLDGTSQSGGGAFVAQYDTAGNLAWLAQLGLGRANGVAVDGAGSVYITGVIGGDALLVKYEVPEPATLALLALGGLAMLRRRR